MKHVLKTTLAAAALGSLILIQAGASADAAGRRMGPMMGEGCMWGFMMGPHGPEGYQKGKYSDRHKKRMKARLDERLDYMKDQLGIKDEQKDAWEEYAEAVEDRMEAMQAVHENMMEAMDDGDTVERMDAHLTAMEAMLESLKEMKPKVEKLYGTLSKKQKRLIDNHVMGMHCGI